MSSVFCLQLSTDLSADIQKIFDIDIPGLGIVILFLLITLLGLIGSTIIACPIKRLVGKEKKWDLLPRRI